AMIWFSVEEEGMGAEAQRGRGESCCRFVPSAPLHPCTPASPSKDSSQSQNPLVKIADARARATGLLTGASLLEMARTTRKPFFIFTEHKKLSNI
ncbi:hypothetical protein, partial [Nostoc sp. UCD121]|uniref:hypothetical protein n=1 Tax=Nostoc sp. UCD121 TaxID=2681305 RepID=UPI001C89F561